MRKTLLSLIVATTLSADVNFITDSSDYHTKWLVEDFTKETGIKVNLLNLEKGLVSRVVTEPDAVIFSNDVSNLVELNKRGTLINNLGTNNKLFKSDTWTIVSSRDRGFFVKKGERVPTTYDELLEPYYKGKVCIRPLTHNYNLVLFSNFIETKGEEYTKDYITKLKGQLSRVPSSNDRGQVKAIYDGECTVSVGNSYYMGMMQNDKEQVKWANAVDFITPKDVVSLYSAIGATKNTPDNKKFITWILSKKVQDKIKEHDFVNTNITKVNSNLNAINDNKAKAYKLVRD